MNKWGDQNEKHNPELFARLSSDLIQKTIIDNENVSSEDEK